MKFNVFSISILFFLILALTNYLQADDTLVLALSFDDGQGNIAKDSSQYKLDGTLQGGPKWVDGKFNKALEFDGVDDLVEVPDSPQLRLDKGGTLMAWAFIKKGGHTSWPRLLHKSNTTGGTVGYEILLDRALGDAIRVCVGGACQSFVPVPSESWHNIAVTFDGKTVLVYLDGSKVGENPQPGPQVDNKDMKFYVGNSFNVQRQYQGIIDEVKVWSRILNANEIKTQMNLAVRDTVSSVQPFLKATVTWAEIKNR